MLAIKLTVEDVDLTFCDTGPMIYLTGTDPATGDLVTFGGSAYTMLDLIDKVRAEREITTEIHDFQVVRTEPTSGQWDSPGTSPEEDV